MTKYGARRTEIDGHSFASQREANRYGELRLLEQAGEISGLELQPKFPLIVNGQKVATYIADFRYVDAAGAVVVEDVKSGPTKTPVYRMKAKLMLACYNIRIRET